VCGVNQKRRGAFLQIMWTAAIMLCIVIALFSVIYASAVKGRTRVEETAVGTSLPPGGNTSPGTDQSYDGAAQTDPTRSTEIPDYDAVTLGETEDMGLTYLDNFVFLGDSTIGGLKDYNIVGERQVWIPQDRQFALFNEGIISVMDPVSGENLSIDEIFTRYRPEYVLISVGADGTGYMDRERFIRDYTNLVRRIQVSSPETKIILDSIYPCTRGYADSHMSGNGGVSMMIKISMGNDWIRQVALDTGTVYLDSVASLKNEDGYLPDSFTAGDGMHLNAEALNEVISYLRTHAYQQGNAQDGGTPPVDVP